jgi:biopolymer transport protein ExbD
MGGGAMTGGKGKRGGIVGINMTPMVDIMLVLLVIMMVSATYIVSQSLKVELPKSASTDEAAPKTSTITVTREGGYLFDQEPMADDAALQAKLAAAHGVNPEMSVVITADAAALHGKVVHAIDLAKQTGILKFAISVQRD